VQEHVSSSRCAASVLFEIKTWKTGHWFEVLALAGCSLNSSGWCSPQVIRPPRHREQAAGFAARPDRPNHVGWAWAPSSPPFSSDDVAAVVRNWPLVPAVASFAQHVLVMSPLGVAIRHRHRHPGRIDHLGAGGAQWGIRETRVLHVAGKKPTDRRQGCAEGNTRSPTSSNHLRWRPAV